MVLGLNDLPPGSRTYEPPYLGPAEYGGHSINSSVKSPMLDIKPEAEHFLSPEQARIVELAASGCNIFYTGSAGSGKSRVLHAIRRRRCHSPPPGQ